LKAKPGTINGDQAQHALLRGAAQMVAAVRPTLGPRPRLVALTRSGSSNQAPEFLDDGATIARRIIEIGDRDGSVTTGVLY